MCFDSNVTDVRSSWSNDDQIDNKPVLVQLMACRQTGDKPLSEPMLTQITDAYMRH